MAVLRLCFPLFIVAVFLQIYKKWDGIHNKNGMKPIRKWVLCRMGKRDIMKLAAAPLHTDHERLAAKERRMNQRELREEILTRIQLPRIPGRKVRAEEFGIVPNDRSIQTEALQRAIDTISAEGGGTLLLPGGSYRTGALRLRSGVELRLQEADTVLQFANEEIEGHYPLVYSHWEASPCYNFSALLYACDARDIAVTGLGRLEGGADKMHWWSWHHQVEEAWSSDEWDRQRRDRSLLRRMNEEGVPVEQRRFGPGHFLRPMFVQLLRCERVLLQGITLKNSPMWQINPVMCRSLTVKEVTMSSHGPNNDGCDPESCSGVLIQGCRFDTGDDCISLKSGRDRDGRSANRPCEYVLIEENEFADGHGGIALGSEMSGGIRCVLAVKNRFSSPRLTYALRLKTNARRGGYVEDVILADSAIEYVHGAAVHGTMLYEDGRNGAFLPHFRRITIENLQAHGGDYGIFLEAFQETPITGLRLSRIQIDGVVRPMRSMNWKDACLEQVRINGKEFPRPGRVRILGVTARGEQAVAAAEYCGGSREEWERRWKRSCRFFWECSEDENVWRRAGEGETLAVPSEGAFLRLTVQDEKGNEETSRSYRILSEKQRRIGQEGWERLICRRILEPEDHTPKERLMTRGRLAPMLLALTAEDAGKTEAPRDCLAEAVRRELLAPDGKGMLCPEGFVTRQEMATAAMQACGVSYRNASSTMPVCRDADQVGVHYGTNVARALYFGFMETTEDGRFEPDRRVTMGETVEILDRVADFAGI